MGGASSSKKYNNVYVTETKVLAWQSRFDLLRLSEKEIGQLYEVFVNVTEASQRNYIKARDIITYCNMDKYAFAVRMLSSFAKKGQSFAGFVFEIWDICTTDEKDLADFVFSLYDFTGEGITADEAQTMLSELYGETAFKNEKRRTELMTHLYGSATEARPVSRTQFKMFTRKQAPSLFMAFSVQKKISESIVGKPFWDAQCRKRNKMSPKDLTTIGQVRQEILTGRLTMDDEGFENTNTADEGSQTTLSDLDSSARRRTSVNKDKDKDKKSGEKKEHSSKKSKVHVHEAPPGPTKITISAGSSSTTTSSSRKNHGGLGGLGMNGSRKGSARSSFESNNQGSDNNSPAVPGTPVELLPGEEEHKTKGQGFYLKDSIDQDKVKRSLSLGGGDGHQATYLEEVHGINKAQSESVINKSGKKTGASSDSKAQGGSEKKPKKKKLVEAADSRLNKSSLKDLLKGSMAVDDDDDDVDADSKMQNAMVAIGAGLSSEGEGNSDKGGLLGMFGRVQKKKLAKTKKPKVEEVLPPSILVTVTKKEEKKKKEEKRVVFDLPDDADEDDYGCTNDDDDDLDS